MKGSGSGHEQSALCLIFRGVLCFKPQCLFLRVGVMVGCVCLCVCVCVCVCVYSLYVYIVYNTSISFEAASSIWVGVRLLNNVRI